MSSTSNSSNDINEKDNVLIYPKKMPEESGLAAIVDVIAYGTFDVKGVCLANKKIYEEVSEYKNIYILGSYWNSILDKFPSNKSIFLYSRESDKYTDPLEFIKTEILKNFMNKPLVQSFFRRHEKFLILTVKKYLGDVDAKFNVCFTGLWQIANNMFDAYKIIFSEQETFETCSEKGKHAIISNQKIAERRSINNSYSTDKTGAKVSITCGPELNYETHKELKRQHPDSDVTQVEFTLHGKNPVHKVSVWSWNDNYDVSSFTKVRGGGGSKSKAGFSVKIDNYYEKIIFNPNEIGKK